jgi:hypothetical protein
MYFCNYAHFNIILVTFGNSCFEDLTSHHSTVPSAGRVSPIEIDSAGSRLVEGSGIFQRTYNFRSVSHVLTENTNFNAYVSPVNLFVYVKLASEREGRVSETQE